MCVMGWCQVPGTSAGLETMCCGLLFSDSPWVGGGWIHILHAGGQQLILLGYGSLRFWLCWALVLLGSLHLFQSGGSSADE